MHLHISNNCGIARKNPEGKVLTAGRFCYLLLIQKCGGDLLAVATMNTASNMKHM